MKKIIIIFIILFLAAAVILCFNKICAAITKTQLKIITTSEGSKMENTIFTGTHGNNHIQGIAVDDTNGYIYYSFTTKLIKARLDGTIIGSVDGLIGHLGCISFNADDGKVYGSLEFKNDSIGKSIRKKLGVDTQFDDAFYIAIFDVDKIDRFDMDAESDDVMTAAYLKEVVDDYHGTGVNRRGSKTAHRLGCSGIDGTAIGPEPGSDADDNFLLVAYGIYGDKTRDDNDYQVILRYSPQALKASAKPLSQLKMHKSGPAVPLSKYYVYTGNTVYGVQNLEYDAYTSSYFMAVYRGQKKAFPNWDLFMIDSTIPAHMGELKGIGGSGEILTLKEAGECKNGIYGRRFDYGSTGLYARGNGTYLISEPHSTPDGQCAYIREYTYTEKDGFVLNG